MFSNTNTSDLLNVCHFSVSVVPPKQLFCSREFTVCVVIYNSSVSSFVKAIQNDFALGVGESCINGLVSVDDITVNITIVSVETKSKQYLQP